MPKNPKVTSLSFESEEEALELKADAVRSGMDVSKYLRKLAKDARDARKEKGEVKSEEKQSTINDTSKTITITPKTNQPEIIENVNKIEQKKEEIKPKVIVPEIKYEVKTMADTGIKEDMEAIAEKAARKIRDDDKLKDMIEKVYNKQCIGEECISKLEKKVSDLEQTVKKPEPKKWKCSGKDGCGEDTLIEGMPFCPNCGRKVNWTD